VVLTVLAKAVLDLEGHQTEGTYFFFFLGPGPWRGFFFWRVKIGPMAGVGGGERAGRGREGKRRGRGRTREGRGREEGEGGKRKGGADFFLAEEGFRRS
jgi:hypothetical protein